MRLYLVRHGETDWNRLNKIQGQTDTLLNEQGRRQAKELAQKIIREAYDISEIYSSRQKRALETARIAGQLLGLEPVVRTGLEEVNMGKWEGYTWNQVREEFADEYCAWYDNRRYANPPEGESYQQLLNRFLPAVRNILDHAAGNVLIVTHSAVIMTFLSYLYEKPFEDMARNFKTKNAELIEIDADKLNLNII